MMDVNSISRGAHAVMRASCTSRHDRLSLRPKPRQPTRSRESRIFREEDREEFSKKLKGGSGWRKMYGALRAAARRQDSSQTSIHIVFDSLSAPL